MRVGGSAGVLKRTLAPRDEFLSRLLDLSSVVTLNHSRTYTSIITRARKELAGSPCFDGCRGGQRQADVCRWNEQGWWYQRTRGWPKLTREETFLFLCVSRTNLGNDNTPSVEECFCTEHLLSFFSCLIYSKNCLQLQNTLFDWS